MSFVSVKTGKPVKLETGYVSNPVDYQTWKRQQEAKRAGADPPASASASAGTHSKGGTGAVKAKGDTSTAAMNQAAVSPSRMYDLMVGAAKTYGSGFAGFGGLAAETVAAADKRASQSDQRARQEKENIRRYQTMLSRGTMDDGTPIDAARRRQLEGYIKSSQRFVDADAAYQEQVHAPLSAASEAAYQKAADLSKSGQKNIERAKRGLGAAGRFAVDVGVAGAQMAGDAALGAATGGSALLPMFLRSAGGAASEGKETGADYGGRALYALGSGALGAATEKISNVAGPFKKMFGSGAAEKIAGKLVSRFGENQAVQIMFRLSQTAAGKTLLSAIGEGTEELTESILDVPLRRATIDRGAAFDPVEAGYEFLVGAALGGVGGAVEGVQNRAQRRTAQNQTETAPEARQAPGEGTDTAPTSKTAQNAAQAPRDVLMEAAARGGRLEDGPDMVKEPEKFRLRDTEGTGETVWYDEAETRARTAREFPALNRLLFGQEAETTSQTGPTDSTRSEGIMEREIRRLFGGGKRLSPDSLTEAQMSAVEAANGLGTVDMDAENRLYQVNPEEHIDRRDIQSAGDKRVRAFQFDHPQLRPYYAQAAQALSVELEHYIPGGETASRVSEDGNPYSYRMSRSATPRIAELIDRYGVKPSQIGPAIEAILQDHGQENSAAAKRLEIMLDEMLTGGYQDAVTGEFVGPNQEYIDLKRQIAGAAEAGRDSVFMEGDGGLDGVDTSLTEGEDRGAIQETGEVGTVPADGQGKNQGETAHVIKRLQESVPQISKQAPVAFTSSKSIFQVPGDTIAAKARTLFNAIKGVVARPGFGEIEINNRAVKDDLSHGVGPAKTAVIPAIPAILRSGVQIDSQQNWKGRAYDGYIFAAPVVMDGDLVFVAAVVKQTSKKRLYLHEVVDSNGNIIKINDEVQANPTSLAAENGAGAQTPSSPEGTQPISFNNIAQGAENVNPSGGDGLGAADAGSLNSDYDRLQAQSGTFHPEGANAARPVDVPTRDFDGRNISKSASTILGAEILNDADAARLEQLVADGGFSFDTIHDKDALGRAQDTLRVIGFDRALERYIQAAQSNTAAKDNTVLGQVLMLEAARGGNRRALAEIASLYARNSTNIAQAMQAQKILRQLGPADRLYALQKSVNELAEKYQVDIELDQTALDDFVNAANEEVRQEAEARLIQSAASQLPTSFRAKYDAVRYLAMLGNPRTHIRNILGNTAFQIPAIAKNRAGAAVEMGYNLLSGKKAERTKSLAGANPFGALAREARADWANARPFLEGGKYSEGRTTAGAIEREAKPFQNSSPVGKAIGWAADKNGALLEAEDNLVKRWIYSQSLAGYLKANGVKSISVASPDLLSRARNYAAQEALRNTFNDRNDFSDFVAKLGNLRNSENKTARAASYLTEGLLPFKRTPANVAARAVEYSPAGSVLDIVNAVRDAKAGKMDQETVLKHLDRQAAALSGTALLGLGFLLSGMITGGEDEDKDQQNFDDLTGRQNYALELDNGTSVTLDWLAPSAIPFFMGVELAHAWQDGGLSPDKAINALKNMSEPMLEMSMLQGLNDVFENAAYAQQHGGSVLGSAVVSAASGYLTQVFPTFFGQLERTAEDRRMTTYADKNDRFSKDLQFFLGKVSQKVPGWDYHQIPYLDAWGREEETGDALQRAFNNMINPAYVSQVKVDAVEKELQRVADATGTTGVFPDRAPRYFTVDKERKDLTAEEYQKYARKRGQLSLETLRQMMDSPGYQKLGDEKKAEAVAAVYQYADSLAKMEVSDYRPGKGTVAAGALKSMLPPASYILYKMNSDRDGDGKVSRMESAQTLQELPGLTDKQRGEAWGAFNTDAKAFKNPFTGALAKKGMDPEEAQTAWDIYGRSGTREEPYTEARKKQDLREDLGLSVMDAAQLYRLMQKAAERK